MTERIFNFSAGPAVLPLPVLEEAQRDLLSLPGVGMSVMEISHRSKTFDEIIGTPSQDYASYSEFRRTITCCSCKAALVCSFQWCR
jgi:phosphoserine aminotransferase